MSVGRMSVVFRCLVLVSLLVASGCSQHGYIAPSDSDKQCIKNFKTDGSILSGQSFSTSAVLSAVNRNEVFDQLVERLPAMGFRAVSQDKRRGYIEAIHEATLAGGGEERAVRQVIQLDNLGSDVRVNLSVKTKPGQITMKGNAQHEFCKILEGSQIESFEY